MLLIMPSYTQCCLPEIRPCVVKKVRAAAKKSVRTLIGLCLLTLVWIGPSNAAEATRVVIDTTANTITVFSGDEVVETVPGIAIGRGGAVADRQVGDGSTPTGQFKIGWVNENSGFRRFFGLNYPNQGYADRALRSGQINRRQWSAIHAALVAGLPPPSNTPLGGRIGIHGLGNADPSIHARFNWTQGCIAVTNQQIDRLTPWLLPGTPVEIR